MVKLLIISILAFLITTSPELQQSDSQPQDADWYDTLATATNAKDSMIMCHRITTYAINSDTVYKYSIIQKQLATRAHDTSLLAHAHNTIGWSFYYHCQYDSAIKHYTIASDLLKILDEKNDLAMTYYNLASCYDMLNKVSQSVDYYQKAILLYKETGDSTCIARIYRSIAMRNIDMKEYEIADTYLKRAISLDRQLNNASALADDIYALISMKFDEERYTITRKELDELNASSDTIKILSERVTNKFDKGNLLFKYCHIKSVLLTKYYEFDKKQWMIDSANNLCDSAMNFLKNVRADEKMVQIQLQKAQISYIAHNSRVGVDITDQLKQRYLDSLGLGTKMTLYRVASQCHEGVEDFRMAYVDLCEYIKCYVEYVNKLNIQENANFIANVAMSEMETERNSEQNTHKQELKKQNSILSIIILALLIIIAALFFALRALKAKRASLEILNEKNKQLSRQQEEIMAQRNLIDEQRQATEKANLITYQSIRYARHIQSAALPSEDYIRRVFPEHFVYYEPKDIVSGDFYYVAQNAGLDIFVLADCTGHGVPGGFLSMLGISAIKELLKNPEIDIMPGIILDMMREYIKQALSNDEEVAEAIARGEESFSTADGMDMSIVAYDKYNHILRFAGAYQSLYIARDGDIIRLKGDRMPVGRHINESSSFQTQFFNTQKGDMVYMTSDGIPSQIGFSGVKFMSKRLMDFFKSNYMLPCETQKRNITNIMNDWLFGATQIDDLSLVGIRITE